MKKKGFTIIEIFVVFLIILGVIFLILPQKLDSTKQARLISKWNGNYSNLEYTFSLMLAQKEPEIEKQFATAKNDNEKKQILLEAIKPYLRIKSEVKKTYTQHYMNGKIINSKDDYYFDNFYLTSSNEIIGLKLINPHCASQKSCAIIVFDINGLKGPNKWGYDIFGISLSKTGIEPFGKEFDAYTLKTDCSKKGLGISCAYYYSIGGKFD
jgi:hypothetical protein